LHIQIQEMIDTMDIFQYIFGIRGHTIHRKPVK